MVDIVDKQKKEKKFVSKSDLVNQENSKKQSGSSGLNAKCPKCKKVHDDKTFRTFSPLQGHLIHLGHLVDLEDLVHLGHLGYLDKLLLLFIKEPNIIRNIANKLGISTSLACQRANDLVSNGFLEAIEKEGNATKYRITEAGLKHLISIYEDYQRKQEEYKASEEKQLDLANRIKECSSFIEENYLAELKENLRNNKNFIVVEFNEFSKFDPDLANILLDEPEESFKIIDLAIEQLDLEKSNIKVRFTNLPSTQNISISEIRSKHLNKFMSVEGIVRQQSDVRPQTIAAKFECPNCGNITNVLQLDNSFKEPTRCGCGRKGKFRLLSKDLVDVQGIVLEEIESQIEHLKSKRLNSILKDDLVNPDMEKKCLPGTTLRFNGILKETPIILRTGQKSTMFDLCFEVNSIEEIEKEREIEVSEKDIEKIKIFVKRHGKNTLNALSKKYCPAIYGVSDFKKGLILTNVEGVKKNLGINVRGHINIAAISQPGEAKSQLLKYNSTILPKSRYVSGAGATGVGITAAVVKDEFLKGWTLEAGALPMSRGGVCNIDEADKFEEEQLKDTTEPLEQETITIAKATIQATIKCPVSTVFACNPREGIFKSDGLMGDLPDFFKLYFIDRMDLIFKIFPTDEEDKAAIEYLSKIYYDNKETNIKDTYLKQHITFAKRLKPKLTKEFINKVKAFYFRVKPYCQTVGVYTSKRLYNSLIRLGEASAKIRISKTVDPCDADIVIELINKSLNDCGINIVEEEKISEDKKELIHHKCSICGESPCVDWNNKGEPICKGCKKGLEANA